MVIDPIDGSLNARRMIPLHSVSIAVAEGVTMADVSLGYVYEFGAGEEFVALAGEGRWTAPISVPEGMASRSSRSRRASLSAWTASEALAGRAYRIRARDRSRSRPLRRGRPLRRHVLHARLPLDAAAAQLSCEAGGALSFGGELSAAPLALDARYGIAAARTDADLRLLLEAQNRVP